MSESQRPLAELFDEFVRREGHGRRFNLELLDPDSRLNWIIKRDGLEVEAREHRIPKIGLIYVDYIENLNVNAIAFERDCQDFVGIYIGAAFHLLRFFRLLLCNRTFLPSLGDPGLEVSDPRTLSYADGEQALIPKDPQRRLYARMLATIASDFMLMHEYGHLINGHVKLMNAAHGASYIAELGAISAFPASRIDRQALEMDADCHAVQQCVLTLLDRVADPTLVNEAYRGWYSSVDDALRTWSLAVYGFFRMFDGSPMDPAVLATLSYPPPPMRAIMAAATAIEILRSRGHESCESRCSAAFRNALFEVERATAVNRGAAEFDRAFILPASDPRATTHIGRLKEHWTSVMRPQLEPYARGGKLAP